MKFAHLFLAAMLAMPAASADPGAHGPNGEHLDGQPAAPGAAHTAPRVESFTESFELVGQLTGGELSIMIDRYDTNAPVLGAGLEVQYKNLKAKARFHADLGDYAVDDPKLLAALSKPGEHALVFTLIAGEESDLLEGTLTVPDVAPEHGHEAVAEGRWLWGAGAVAALAAAILWVVRRRRHRKEA